MKVTVTEDLVSASLFVKAVEVWTRVGFVVVPLTFQPSVFCFLVVGKFSFNEGLVGIKSICRRYLYSLGRHSAIRE